MQALIDDKLDRLLHDDLKLLSRNAKLLKTDAYGYYVVGLNMSPADEHIPYGGRVTSCAWASPGCSAGCLKFAGMNNMTTHLATRVAKTLFLERYPVEFHAKLDAELRREEFRASRRGMRLAGRMNLLTDRTKMANAVAGRHPGIQFNDYSASPVALPGPANMYRTYSRKETWEHLAVRTLIDSGKNVAVVFDVKRHDALPTEYRGIEVIDGDLHDARWTDPAGVIVGLRLKGTKKAQQEARDSGFALSPIYNEGAH
jgi:hypothetical protein